jgi:hypothetical protein
MATESEVFAGEGFSVLVQVDRGAMQEHRQLTGCRVFARAAPQLKRAVFVTEGRNFDLLRHQVKFYRCSQQFYENNH